MISSSLKCLRIRNYIKVRLLSSSTTTVTVNDSNSDVNSNISKNKSGGIVLNTDDFQAKSAVKSSSSSLSSSSSSSIDSLNLSLSISSKPPSQSYGLFREIEKDDIKVMVNNFTAPALARALRERESTLQAAAILAENGNYSELNELLLPFKKSSVERRRQNGGKREMDLSTGFNRRELVIIQRYLQKLPREVFHAAGRRASVVIPLCNVNGVASILFERRSSKVRTHKQQVCFPGGMVDEGVDNTIIQTSLRELEEELGIPSSKTEVLGILRCNWNEVASMTGIAVTPVVGYIGELNDLKQYLCPNPDEVEQLFTVPMERFLNKNNWEVKKFSTPVFTGGQFVIWGLTAYLLEKFIKDVVMKCELKF